MSRTLSNVSATLRPVFDLANAGPRHRFTVLTDAGPLIVSNCILGLGFQTGPDKLRHTLFIGNGGVSVNVELTEARDMVWTYRNTYPEIPDLWDTGEVMLAHMRLMGKDSAALNPHKTYPIVTYNERAIWLPNGMAIQYPNLRYEARPNSLKKETLYDTPQGTTNIFGGKVTENCDQALSRIVVTDIARRVVHQTSYEPFLSTHDSLDYCVPEHQVRDFDALLEYEFSISPTWAPNLPLASEGGWGRSLLDAERMLNT